MVSRPAFFHQMTFEDDDVLNNLKIKIKKNVTESRKYTNVKAAMTDWRHFNKDEDFVKIATSLTQNLAYNGLGFFKNMDQSEVIKADYEKVYDMYDKINDFDFLFLQKKICLDENYCISSPSPNPSDP